MSVGFNSIPMNIRTPGNFMEFDSSRALQGLPVIPQVALIVAPRLTSGDVAALTPFQISSPLDAEAGFGRHSIGSFMGKAFKAANQFTELWGLGVADNGSGVAATGTITFTGPATSAGTVNVYVGGISIPVPVASGDSATVMGTSLVSALAGVELPVTMSNSSGAVTVTARNAGTTGNAIDLRINYNPGDALPAGVGVAIVAMASGATDGAISSAITAMGDVQYHTIASAWNAGADLALFETELLNRWGSMRQKAGFLFAAIGGSAGTMETAGEARNSFLGVLFGSHLSPTPAYVWAATVAGVDAFQTSVDPFRPRTGLALPGCLPPARNVQLEQTDRQVLLTDGIATFTIDTGGNCLIERLITTYQTNSADVADTAYLDIMTPRGLDALRYTQNARIGLKFPRSKLAADGTKFDPGQPIVTPSIIKSELIALYIEWISAGWTQDLADFKAGLIVELNGSDPDRIDILSDPNLITALMVTATQMQFLLGVPATAAA